MVKASEAKPTENKFVDSLVWTLFELVISVVYGVVVIFLTYVFTGMNKANYYTRAANLVTEIASYFDLFEPLLHT